MTIIDEIPVAEAFPALASMGDAELIALARRVDENGAWEATRSIGFPTGSRFRDVERWVRQVAAAWSPVTPATLAERAEQSGWTFDAGTRYWDRKGQGRHASADEHRGDCFRHAYANAVPCHECGGWTDEDSSGSDAPDTQVNSRMRRRELGECFGCNFWLNLVRRADDLRHVRVEEGGQVGHYTICGATGGTRGYGGHRFDIEWLDGRTPPRATTNNLWHQGVVPERFLDRLPVNARFVR